MIEYMFFISFKQVLSDLERFYEHLQSFLVFYAEIVSDATILHALIPEE